jgi:hypothetical protein
MLTSNIAKEVSDISEPKGLCVRPESAIAREASYFNITGRNMMIIVIAANRSR